MYAQGFETATIFGGGACFHAQSMLPVRATTILYEFERVQAEVLGKAVILTDGKAGTVETVWLDELHGLRISIRGHEGKWPISSLKLAQAS